MTTEIAILEPTEIILPKFALPNPAEIRKLFAVDEKAVSAACKESESIDATTKDGYALAVRHRANFRTTRVGIDKKRVELKADSLEYGRTE